LFAKYSIGWENAFFSFLRGFLDTDDKLHCDVIVGCWYACHILGENVNSDID